MKYNLENPKLIILKDRKVSHFFRLDVERICVVTALCFPLLLIHKYSLVNIALYIFYKAVCKFENNIVHFRECRCEMLFQLFIMMLNYCIYRSKFFPGFFT